MFEALKNEWLASYKESMDSDGFVICCSHRPEGERFHVVTKDDATRLTLLYEHDFDAFVPLTEANLRTKLTHVGMSVDVIDAKIRLARTVLEAAARNLGPVVRLTTDSQGHLHLSLG
jgi:hypothetical protein